MVESNADSGAAGSSGAQETTAAEQTQVAAEQPSGTAATGGASSQWVTTDSAPMDPEEEANLAAFLVKV